MHCRISVEENRRRSSGAKLMRVGFEPTPSKGLEPKSSALDHSAIASCSHSPNQVSHASLQPFLRSQSIFNASAFKNMLSKVRIDAFPFKIRCSIENMKDRSKKSTAAFRIKREFGDIWKRRVGDRSWI